MKLTTKQLLVTVAVGIAAIQQDAVATGSAPKKLAGGAFNDHLTALLGAGRTTTNSKIAIATKADKQVGVADINVVLRWVQATKKALEEKYKDEEAQERDGKTALGRLKAALQQYDRPEQIPGNVVEGTPSGGEMAVAQKITLQYLQLIRAVLDPVPLVSGKQGQIATALGEAANRYVAMCGLRAGADVKDFKVAGLDLGDPERTVSGLIERVMSASPSVRPISVEQLGGLLDVSRWDA
ncbi:MAG: hypothetical protein LBJ42_00570, partial [Holosporales bacterium]|nr:hypothetical protein [Holosporales bacterium]